MKVKNVTLYLIYKEPGSCSADDAVECQGIQARDWGGRGVHLIITVQKQMFIGLFISVLRIPLWCSNLLTQWEQLRRLIHYHALLVALPTKEALAALAHWLARARHRSCFLRTDGLATLPWSAEVLDTERPGSLLTGCVLWEASASNDLTGVLLLGP